MNDSSSQKEFWDETGVKFQFWCETYVYPKTFRKLTDDVLNKDSPPIVYGYRLVMSLIHVYLDSLGAERSSFPRTSLSNQ